MDINGPRWSQRTYLVCKSVIEYLLKSVPSTYQVNTVNW